MEAYYKNNNVTIYNGDCLEIMSELDITFDACITDPPYGTTACKWDSVIPFEPMWSNLKRLVKSNGAICLFGSEPFSSYLRISNIEMFKYDWIWDKKLAGNGILAKKNPLKIHEICSVFNSGIYYPQMTHGKKRKKMTLGLKKCEIYSNSSVPSEYTNDLYYPISIVEFSTANMRKGRFHPTQKPVALIEYLIKTYTNENNIVLDFTCGSGTTGVAAMNTNRRCVLIEQEEKYCEISASRCEEARSNIA